METDDWPHCPAADDDLWSLHLGASAVLGTAIHNGHGMRSETRALTALSGEQRLREEDPFTDHLIRDLPNRIVAHRSRFEVDLNRARDGAVYLVPEQSWGLSVWRERPPGDLIAASLSLHDDYYDMLALTLRQMEKRHGAFAVLDIHSYNHRRQGPDAAATPLAEAPDINIGTFSMDRDRWRGVVDALMEHLSAGAIAGRRLDVRENVSFQGKGEQTRFIHDTFPRTGCAIAVEFKKIFMDEWTGEPDRRVLGELRSLLASAVPVIEHALGEA
ncbi:N-formylglutamate amidohydrolase [Pseudochelatococcus sp. B33]